MTESKNIESSLIDVDSIFKNKNPRVYKLLPRFIINYIKRAIHQDEINTALIKYRDFRGLEFLSRVLDELGINYSVQGEENIPATGRFIFVANHPLGGLDGIILIDIVGRHFKKLKSIVNDLLMNIKNLEPLFVPVNKHGRQSAAYVEQIRKLYLSDEQILNFPAGICSRKQNGKIVDLEWKKSFIRKAIEHQRDIIPVYFEGRNSNFFYTLASIRQKLGIKSNIEMFYLPDEMFRQKHQKIKAIIGKPISHTYFDKSKTHSEWAEEIKKNVYLLGNRKV